MKQKNSVLLSATFGAVFCAGLCLCSSPLSDVEITDFGLVGATITISKSFKASGSPVATVRARIYDKNFATVQIQDGSVSVNGITMPYRSGALYNCYEKDNIALVKNTLYTFVVTLPGGDTCTSTLLTPLAEFGTVTIPTDIKINQEATVTWSEVAAGSSIGVRITHDDQSIIIFETTSMPDSGRFVIPRIVDTALAGPATITLTRTMNGTASGKLRSGSTRATYAYSDSTEIFR